MGVALLLIIAFSTSLFGNTQSAFAQTFAFEQTEQGLFETGSVIVT